VGVEDEKKKWMVRRPDKNCGISIEVTAKKKSKVKKEGRE
jgi:hypothetical protein